MKKFNFLLVLIALAGIGLQWSCNSSASINARGFTIKGVITNANNLSFYLDRINFDNTNKLFPKAEIDANGNFTMHFDEKLEEGIYRMRIGAKKAYIYLDGSESLVNIEGDMQTFDKYNYSISGVSASEGLMEQLKGLRTNNTSPDKVEAYLNRESSSIAAAFVAMNAFAGNPNKIELLKSVNQKLKEQHPDSKYSKDFNDLLSRIEVQIVKARAKEIIQVGKPAPEIKLENPEGKEMALSDLKGKIVLLDFWASWCRPCRIVNPQVVQTYKKYKDQGFTVYSVSLDGIDLRMTNKFKTQEQIDQQIEASKRKWEQAIEKDQLEWEYHVSDLRSWGSIAALTYGVDAIPKTFLIDREGIIVALNPKANLEAEIQKLL